MQIYLNLSPPVKVITVSYMGVGNIYNIFMFIYQIELCSVYLTLSSIKSEVDLKVECTEVMGNNFFFSLSIT